MRNPSTDLGAARVASDRYLPLRVQLNAASKIRSWPNYVRTPLVELRGLARACVIGQVWLKDESSRFGLGSFKALGGAYAVECLAQGMPTDSLQNKSTPRIFACATDGNHGRAVAWGAHNLGFESIIYLHKRVSAGREAVLRELGAKIVRVEGSYDDSVRDVARDAAKHGWTLIGDTSDNEQDTVPALVMAGYTVLFEEIVAQLQSRTPPTHLFVQAGVGSLAAAAIAAACRHWTDTFPRIISVEPDLAPCIFRSLQAAKRITVPGSLHTIMAGLACGKVSFTAWPILEAGVSDAVLIADGAIPAAMQLMFRGHGEDPGLTCGESGVAGVAALMAMTGEEGNRASLGLGADSRVLVINTEGATDPAIFASLVPEAAVQCAHNSMQQARSE